MRKAILLVAATALMIGGVALAGEKGKCPFHTQQCLNKMAEDLMNKGFIGIDGKWDDAAGGLRVTEFIPGSKAADAGIRPGDVFVEVNGIRLTDEKGYAAEIAKWKPGQQAEIAVLRDGAKHKMTVTLVAAPADIIAAQVGRHMIEAHSKAADSAAR
jgi:C-terminal processing protease CtpA/Prc